MGDAKHGVSERAYIAKSNCTAPARTPWRALHPVVNGKSSTHVGGIDIGQVKQGRYSIIIEGASGSPVSCGNFQI